MREVSGREKIFCSFTFSFTLLFPCADRFILKSKQMKHLNFCGEEHKNINLAQVSQYRHACITQYSAVGRYTFDQTQE